MSAGASDVQTDEDFEEMMEEGFSLPADILETSENDKTVGKKRAPGFGRPPPSPRSPYLSSLNMTPRRAAVSAWRPLRAASGDTRRESRGDTLGDSAILTALNNGHGLTQSGRSESDMTPEYLKQTLTMRKHKQSRMSSNGHTPSPADYRGREDMYDEIIHLKKTLQDQRSDNQQMKAKLRRLEEDKTKREKQIEELLDPTKGSEYTRSLVDKRKDGSAVLTGLKQRILKLEQQCQEKENALSKLQSDLRTTNLEELRITVETYFEEIQRLRKLLEAAEKSSRTEIKGSQRQQRVLSSTVLRLTESLKQIQQENQTMKEELNTDTPVEGPKGYRDWSKLRLVRKLLELEKRLDDRRRNGPSGKSASQLEENILSPASEVPEPTQGLTQGEKSALATTQQVGEEHARLRGLIGKLEKEKEELRRRLTHKDEELKRRTEERDRAEEETERCKDEQTRERDNERKKHKQELARLRLRIQTLEEEVRGGSPAGPLSPRAKDEPAMPVPEEEEERQREDGNELEEETGLGEEDEKRNARTRDDRENAAKVIQRGWREHRDKDVVLLQSALRGHILRQRQLSDLQKRIETKNGLSECDANAPSSSACGDDDDVVAVTMIQSVFRGHLQRSSLANESSKSSFLFPSATGVPTPAKRSKPPTIFASSTVQTSNGDEVLTKEDPWPVANALSSKTKRPPAPLELHPSADSTMMDSDDSDDIIVSPSRPMRRREESLF